MEYVVYSVTIYRATLFITIKLVALQYTRQGVIVCGVLFYRIHCEYDATNSI